MIALVAWNNSRPSASNFKSFSRSLEQYLGQNNFGNKIPFLQIPTVPICALRHECTFCTLCYAISCCVSKIQEARKNYGLSVVLLVIKLVLCTSLYGSSEFELCKKYFKVMSFLYTRCIRNYVTKIQNRILELH